MKIRSKFTIIKLILIFLLFSITFPVNAETEYEVVGTLESPDPTRDGDFGVWIDFNEEIIVVGEWGVYADDFRRAGKAHVFDYNGNLIFTLQSPNPVLNGRFGGSLAVIGDIIIIGEEGATVNGFKIAGQVHFFDSEGSLQRTIESPEPNPNGLFGGDLAKYGEKIVIAEIGADVDGKIKAGKAHLFDFDGNHKATMQSPDPETQVRFGFPGLNDDYIVVSDGATVDDKEGAGRVHIFDADGLYITSLQSPEPVEEGFFGASAVDEEIIAISESAEVEGHLNAGKVYIYDFNGNLLLTLQSPEPREEATFGENVAISEDLIAVMEFGEEGGEAGNLVYVFDREGNLLSTIHSPEPTGGDFGAGIYFIGDLLAVVDAATVLDQTQAGRVYLFQESEAEPSPTPTPEPTPKPQGGIPGFPLESVVAGLVLVIILLWFRK
jgi:hypothetical protein